MHSGGFIFILFSGKVIVSNSFFDVLNILQANQIAEFFEHQYLKKESRDYFVNSGISIESWKKEKIDIFLFGFCMMCPDIWTHHTKPKQKKVEFEFYFSWNFISSFQCFFLMTKSDCKFHVWQISSWSLNSQNSLFFIISRRNWRMISDKVTMKMIIMINLSWKWSILWWIYHSTYSLHRDQIRSKLRNLLKKFTFTEER